MPAKRTLLFVASFLLMGLAACGHKGPLYLPDDPSGQEPAVQTTTP